MKVLFCLLLALASASLFEWKLERDAKPTEDVEFTLRLTQHNLKHLEQLALQKSDPTHPDYANWMTIEEINDIISPPKAEKKRLEKVLKTRGISVKQDRGDNFVVSGKVSAVEALFSTNVTVYKHLVSGRELMKCDRYTIPSALKPTVEFIIGLQELPLKSSTFPKRRNNAKKTGKKALAFGSIIPGFVRQIYNMPSTTFSNKASLGLIEFLDYSSYSRSALQEFLKETNNPAWTVTKTVGPFAGDGLESVLDIQFGGTLARGLTIWFWTGQRWLLDFTQNFFATQSVPQVISMSWGWPSNLMCPSENGPGQCTNMNSKQYATAVNTEFMKIALRGITAVGASGDQGAPGDGYYTCSGGLSDIMPASSQWVTAIGATQLGSQSKRGSEKKNNVANPFGAPVCGQQQCANNDSYEVVCSYANNALITSGGGFQTYFSMPTWQQSVVKSYLASAPNLPPSSQFNASNRAFPDVSALGHNYLIYDSGEFEDVDGTSASTPVWGAMIATWNSVRLGAGKKTLGFVAPMLYQAAAADPTLYHDITQGDNTCTESCCGSLGYTATKGWDAATGIGTPNYAKLLGYVSNLP